MTKSMPRLSSTVVEEFCKLCDWAREVWLNHLELFDNNQRASELTNPFAGEEFARLSVISHEYSLLQIVKLHGKAFTNGIATLGIDYVLTYGNWSDSVRDRLQKLADELSGFASQLRDARNKSLSHNDLATIEAGTTLGEFANGADEKYFKTLEAFVNTVYDQVVGGPWAFNNHVKNDVAAFLATIKP
jgi:hypothetical protein